MKKNKKCDNHTSKIMKDKIIDNINKQLNIKEKVFLLILRRYTLKIFKSGFQSCFNWEHEPHYTKIKNADATQNKKIVVYQTIQERSI